MKIELSANELLDLVMILGAAEGVFSHQAEDASTPGILKDLVRGYAERADELRRNITDQHNTQFGQPNKKFDLWDVLRQHGVRIGEGGDIPTDLYDRAYYHATWSSYVTLPDGKPYLITAIQMDPING